MVYQPHELRRQGGLARPERDVFSCGDVAGRKASADRTGSGEIARRRGDEKLAAEPVGDDVEARRLG